MKESKLAKPWLAKWQEKNPGGRLFRNNCGTAWQGLKHWLIRNLKKTLFIKNPRPVSYGIGIKNKKGNPVGGGDYIGWTEKTLCEITDIRGDFEITDKNGNTLCDRYCNECPFSKNIAIFTNIEFKTKNISESKEQIKFRKMVIAAGGISEVIKEE